MKIHHIGVATLDIEGAMATYQKLGYQLERLIEDPLQKVRIALLSRPSEPLMELLTPLDKGDGGPLRSLKEKRMLPIPYHTGYSTPVLETAAEQLREMGFFPTGPALPAVAFDGARVQFFLSRTIGLIELVELPVSS